LKDPVGNEGDREPLYVTHDTVALLAGKQQTLKLIVQLF
jgi:hypothetical protein